MGKWSLVLGLLLLLLVACGGEADSPTTVAPAGDTSGGDDPILTIEGRAFGSVPQLASGESMTIVNLDSVRHTFTSGDDSWESVELAGDSEATFTVPDGLPPGDYIFFCEVHADMGGRLTVTG
ncbi:MAG TPA: cupredoxin domain-containing protein [Acidimicrobiia bacterium]|nr:cupredoxin domain-containing protein [Acidimicrobiia bacterium]